MTRIVSDLTITDYITEDEVVIPKKYVTYFYVASTGKTRIKIEIGGNRTKDISYSLKK